MSSYSYKALMISTKPIYHNVTYGSIYSLHTNRECNENVNNIIHNWITSIRSIGFLMKTKTITLSTMTIALAIALIGGLAVAPVTVEARRNLNPDGDGVSGGSSYQNINPQTTIIGGGEGGHTDSDDDGSFTSSGGRGFNGPEGDYRGGQGSHTTCDDSGCDTVGSGFNGLQEK
jgi:hypothetical protein